MMEELLIHAKVHVFLKFLPTYILESNQCAPFNPIVMQGGGIHPHFFDYEYLKIGRSNQHQIRCDY